jgi:hypothetical protein
MTGSAKVEELMTTLRRYFYAELAEKIENRIAALQSEQKPDQKAVQMLNCMLGFMDGCVDGIDKAPHPVGDPVPSMVTVDGKRFRCERCGANVFGKILLSDGTEIFRCGCGTEYGAE